MNVFDRTRAVFQNSSAVFWALGSKSAEESVQILPGLNQLSLVGWTRANEKKEKKKERNKKKGGKKEKNEENVCSTRHNTTQIRNKAYISLTRDTKRTTRTLKTRFSKENASLLTLLHRLTCTHKIIYIYIYIYNIFICIYRLYVSAPSPLCPFGTL